ncbi:MAG: 16S rRNA processing protein RimM [Ignavibacteriaceae bacterium]|nr:16S rRNA processing protein RimM [Ignavibacterium sp.]MCC6253989.1 16S rRNA processing protein RimM [Ignavibacteriaceae bacterium]HMN24925.1 ribosome maturation factor RimM [Ignavibacteriaceae bacterium]HRP92423.1 ribosome maturation factor RimM [Ignavibacteriaceae bacterium]HRQ54953.1 ribosome maturation factor RimM [Ignavibacteriaceae bacterium]
MNEFYLIAKILSAGKDGFVKAQLVPGFYVNQDSIKFLYLDFWDQKKKVELEEVLVIKNSILFKFKNFDNERDSSLFIGRNIFVLMSDLEKVKSNEFTTHNLVGCRLFKGTDLLGSVIDYFETPANPVIEIIKEDGNKILIPFVHSIFEKIDPENNILILNPDFGIDDNED